MLFSILFKNARHHSLAIRLSQVSHNHLEDFHENGPKIPKSLWAEKAGTKLQNCFLSGALGEFSPVIVIKPCGSFTKNPKIKPRLILAEPYWKRFDWWLYLCQVLKSKWAMFCKRMVMRTMMMTVIMTPKTTIINTANTYRVSLMC